MDKRTVPCGKIQTERDVAFVNLWASKDFDPARKVACAQEVGFPAGFAAKVNSGRIVKNMAANEQAKKAMKKAGIDWDFLAKKLKDLLEAIHPMSEENRPDGTVQHKALVTALQLSEAFPATKIDIDKTERREIVISGEVVARLETYDRQRRELLEEGGVIDVEPESAPSFE